MSKFWRDTLITVVLLAAGATWWKVGDNRQAEIADCVYVGAEDLGTCLVERHGWRVADAERVATDSLMARLGRDAAARAMRESP
jgi:hypothetical protein